MYKLEKFQKIDTSRVLHFKYISVNPTQNCQIVNFKIYDKSHHIILASHHI
jgi:hypothetical protein